MGLKSLFIYLFIYLFSERGEGREKERERNVNVQSVASRIPLAGDLAHNPGMCPDWASNQRLSVRRLALNPLSHTSQGSLGTSKKSREWDK